jgi:DNA-binding SARP family transcriptional activator/predicted ATPase
MLSLSLLGSPRILLDGQPLDSLRRKNRALLFYLAAHREPLTRDHLLTFLWPDTERSAAQRTLRTMVYDLRKQLGEAFVTDGELLGLNAESDVRKFEAGLVSSDPSPSSLTATLELYRGDFLSGFTLTEPPEFDDWVATERERFRSLYIRGLTTLAQRHESARNYAVALEAVSRALAFDPLQEKLQRLALRLHYFSGDRPAAIRRYESLRKLLNEELGVPPSPETRALYGAIITDKLQTPNFKLQIKTDRTAAASADSGLKRFGVGSLGLGVTILPFTGRAAELQTLHSFAASGKFILIEGEPGIGKTRLAAEFIETQQAVKLRGAAHELEQNLPYQSIIDALRSLLTAPEWPALRLALDDLPPFYLAEVARLIPELQTQLPDLPLAASTADESRLWEAVNQFLQCLARQRRLVVFLDDLHWADASSLGLVGYLARRAASPALLLLGTTRPAEARSRLAMLLQALTHEDRLARLAVSSLTEAETRAIAEQLSPTHHDSLSAWLNRTGEGNPFFITELVRFAYNNKLLQKNGVLDLDALAAPYILPPTIQNLILSRLTRLSEDARRVLDVAAVVGREFDFELVTHVAALPEATTLDALDALRTAGLIQPTGGDKFVFDHSLTMEVARQDMGETRRRSLHRRVAESLEAIHHADLDSVAGLIAQHFVNANLNERAASYAFRAGKFAAGLAAWAEAISFCQQALKAESTAPERAAILIAMGSAQFHKGNFAPASETFRAAINQARARDDLSNLEAAYIALNQSLLPQSCYAEAITLGRELRLSGPPELAACAEFLWGSGLGVESAHPAEAERHLREAERLLGQQTEYKCRVTTAQIKYQLGGVMGQQGRIREAVALYRQALDLARQNESALDLLRSIMVYNNLAYHLHLLGDPSAGDYARAGIQVAREKGSLSHLPYLLSTSGEIALAQNDLEAAEKFFAEGLALAEQIPIPERIAGLTANLGLVARQRGEAELATERLQSAVTLADRLGSHHLSVRFRLWLAPLLPPARARDVLREARALAESGNFQRLLDDIAGLEAQLPPA